MKALALFVVSAVVHRHAYIDMDGCVLEKMVIPEHAEGYALKWWMVNLAPTKRIHRRIVFLYVLKLLGVRLFIWTNRGPQHEAVTRAALGKHVRLFSGSHYGAGNKRAMQRRGPCMDDEAVNLGRHYDDLLVK